MEAYQRDHLLNNEFMSDVSFIVADNTFSCHSLIIGSASTVFNAMMTNTEIEDGKRTVKVKDVNPSAFMSLLRFIYRKELVLEKNMIEQLLYVTEKYEILNWFKS